jgi:predicted ATPase
MFKSLRLERFKNFKDAELKLGPFTVLIGANASGKSNIRDAFRILHGIVRGYNLTEIIGEKFSEGGERVWSGVRGGAREIVLSGESSFALICESSFPTESFRFLKEHASGQQTLRYHVEAQVLQRKFTPQVVSESLDVVDVGNLFSSQVKDRMNQVVMMRHAPGVFPADGPFWFPKIYPVLGQIILNFPVGSTKWSSSADQIDELADCILELGQNIDETLSIYRSCRFFDWSLDALRQPCLPDQDILSDNGRNLSSVLHAICLRPAPKKNLLSWIQELTPMDAVDFEFPSDPSGKILATLVERGNQKTTLASASDGTLRFLAFLAAFLGPNPSSFYFFEELENGIHPSRLSLLPDLIENQVKEKGIQVVATTHSPELLARLSKSALENAALVYRAPDKRDAQIIRVVELPEARRLLRAEKAAALFSTGWFETTAHFNQAETNGSPRKQVGSGKTGSERSERPRHRRR